MVSDAYRRRSNYQWTNSLARIRFITHRGNLNAVPCYGKNQGESNELHEEERERLIFGLVSREIAERIRTIDGFPDQRINPLPYDPSLNGACCN